MRNSSRATISRECFSFKKPAALLRALGTPVSRRILSNLQTGNYSAIVSESLTPSDYSDSEAFQRDYLAVNLLRKFDSFPLGIDTASVALVKFLESEAACKQVNLTKVRLGLPLPDKGFTRSYEACISHARRKIQSLLGKFSWDRASEQFAFSSGASTRLTRRKGAPFWKFSGKPDTTRNNAILAVTAIQSIPLWKNRMVAQYGEHPFDWVNVVEGSRITTVAKTAETDRCIAIEPDMNMFVQKGIGALLRQKLKSVHIDLSDQTANQKLAKVGSSTGSLATIDLASASDSISLELVRLLLPYDWFEAMSLCRSEVGILPNGNKHPFEKISSMGNGYTFELESLIFWALSKTVLDLWDVSDRRLGIYGDDIVIHNSVAEDLIDLLAYCGFKTNASKTFLSGPFRESCGKHYFYGKDVTPFYIKTPLETLQRQFWYINSLRLWTSFVNDSEAYQDCYDYAVRSIPKRHRYTVPVCMGSEAGIWASFDEARPRYHTWKQSFSTKLLRSRRGKHRPDGTEAVLHWFNMNGSSRGRTPMHLECGETRYYHSKVYLSWWDTAPCGVVYLAR